MRLSYFLFIILLTTGTVNAQQISIQGTVTDNMGLPLPGVNVLIKNSIVDTQTDFEGNYSISANIGDVLWFLYVGYTSQEVTIQSNSKIINVSLEPDTSELEEVVVTAMGIKREKKALGYAVSKVSSSALITTRSYQRVSRLEGRKSRRKRSKEKHSNKNMNQINIDVTQEPLYIVDGISVDAKDVAIVKAINPNKISKKEILKERKAKRIYGNKAKYGCIVITTKSGNYTVKDDESYKEIVENDFKRVHTAPLSTFSIDVDKASYSNIRRMINNGDKIPADAVKIEEMINYFDYAYKQPTGKHPFAIHTGYVATPWNKKTQLVKIGLKGKEVPNDKIPPSNLVFLIDVSGSMGNHNKLPLLKKAFKLLVNQLREKDKISIVVYAGAAGVVLESTSGANKQKINEALQRLEAGGSTAGGEGIELAYQIAKKNFIKNGNNRVILATDGDFNVGMSSDNDMKKLIKEKRNSGVFLTCLGFGMGNYKDSKLEILADTGNGNHAYIDTMQEAQRILGKEFGGTLYTIAKDVKIQVEFNPKKVQAYRLIGYENRLLEDQDFVDDTKDAGELGSGHTVTALYEIIPVGVKSEYINDTSNLKYTNTISDKKYNDELLTVKFRYKKPQGHKSIEMTHILNTNDVIIASQDLNFAASVAWFAMKLRDSKYVKNKKLDAIISLAQSSKGKDDQGYRSEFIRLMNSYQGL